MNPDKTIRVGDRVTVKTVPFGNAQIHVGRIGVVKRIDTDPYFGSRDRYGYSGYSAYPATPVRYIVEMEGVRKEQIYATAVVKVQEPTISVGDRVIIREGYQQGVTSSVVGRIGEVTAVDRPSYGQRIRYTVKTAEGVADRAARVEKVESVPQYDPPTAAVGDTVVVTRLMTGYTTDDTGRMGTVKKVSEPYKIGSEITPRIYEVDVPSVGRTVKARRVTKVAPEDIDPINVGDSVRVIEGWTSGASTTHAGRIGRVTEKEIRGGRMRYTVDLPGYGRTLFRKVEKVAGPVRAADVPSLGSHDHVHVAFNPVTMRVADNPDAFARRVKAAEEAHKIWGDDADLDRLIGTSEYLLGERTLGTATTGTVAVPPVRTITAAEATPSADEDYAKTRRTLHIGGVEFTYDGTGGDVLETGPGYLKPVEVTQLIEFLQAAQRRFNRDQEPTPF